MPALSRMLGRECLSILLFHRVQPVQDPLFPNEVWADNFRAKMSLLRRFFKVLPMASAVELLAEGRLPPRAVVITFDDGYADNHDVALPILRALGLPATFFIATGYLNGGRMWNDSIIETLRRFAGDQLDLESIDLGRHDTSSLDARRAAIGTLLGRLKYLPEGVRRQTVEQVSELAGVSLPNDLMMNDGQVRALHREGMTIGAHTHMHPILASEDGQRSQHEIEGGKRTLEAIIDAPVRFFAYPNGKPRKDYERRHVDQVRAAGFAAAVSTAAGACVREADRFQLARATPWDIAPGRFAARLLLSRRQLPAALV